MWIIFINMHVHVFIIDSSNSLFCERHNITEILLKVALKTP